MTEANLKSKVRKAALHKLRVPHSRLQVGQGDPDDVYWIPGGRPLLIEFKRPDGKGRFEPLQPYKHEMFRKLGYDVQVHDNYEEALAAIGAAVDAAANPEEGRKVPRRTRSRRAIIRSRLGQD